MTPAQFIARARKNDIPPVILFLGQESYNRRRCREALLAARAVEAEQFDMAESSLAAVIDDARAMSLFASERLMIAVRAVKNVILQDPREIHDRFRDMRTGRINPRNLKHQYPVDTSALRALQRELLSRVGKLAGGWNAGAAKLGAKVPAWVSRQGAGRGAVSVVDSIRQFRITLTNAVKYMTNVSDYMRRVESAIQIQAAKMERKADFLLTRALKRAGWK